MANLNATYPASRFNQNVTMNVKVTGMRAWKLRWLCAIWLVKLAAFVAGCRIDVGVRA